MKFDNFDPVDSSLLFSRNNTQDPRLGDLVTKSPHELLRHSVLIAGYPDDEGIQNNGGRVGAKEGPDSIRKYLYRMTPPLSENKKISFFDVGNLKTKDDDIESRHQIVQKNAFTALNAGYKWFSLGGGHDYGYPDGAAYLEFAKGKGIRPLVINFDAHLDVRPVEEKITSGTPFYRLLSEFKDFDFLEVGIQSQCNSQLHLDWLSTQNGKVLFQKDILVDNKNSYVTILEFLEPYLLKRRPTYLSVDIDVFKTSEAPGCSQAWPAGLAYQDVYKVFEVLKQRIDICSLGIYEVSPPLDHADMTSKLAAQILYQFLYE